MILTMFDNPRMLQGIMGLGANALIHESASVEDLFDALSTSARDGQGGHLIVAMPLGALELSEDVLKKTEHEAYSLEGS